MVFIVYGVGGVFFGMFGVGVGILWFVWLVVGCVGVDWYFVVLYVDIYFVGWC